jgi:hypothetical protein
MTTVDRKRVFGDKVQFKSLSCAPVNKLGVVYLFGVLHDTFDFKIESIPYCLFCAIFPPSNFSLEGIWATNELITT